MFISPHKFIGGPGTPGRARRPPGAVPQPRAGGARRRDGRLREPDRARLPVRHRAPRGGRHAGHRRIDPGGPRVPAQGRRRRRCHPRARARLHPPGHASAGRRTPRSRSWAATRRSGYRSCRSSSATPAATSTTTSWSPCSTTCSASSPAAAARAPGPYGHRLLGIDIETSHEFEREIARGCEGIKPGWVRVNFNYFISEAVFAFILDAVDLVAGDGWRLLPDYRFEPSTGLWRHRAGLPEPPLSLRDIDWRDGRMTYPSHRHREPESRLAGYLEDARRILAAPPRAVTRRPSRPVRSARTSRRCAGSPAGGCGGTDLTRLVADVAVLGIDLGTTEAKAALVALDGRLIGMGRASYPLDRGADGRAEQDPADWWAAVAIGRALDRPGRGRHRGGLRRGPGTDPGGGRRGGNGGPAGHHLAGSSCRQRRVRAAAQACLAGA